MEGNHPYDKDCQCCNPQMTITVTVGTAIDQTATDNPIDSNKGSAVKMSAAKDVIVEVHELPVKEAEVVGDVPTLTKDDTKPSSSHSKKEVVSPAKELSNPKGSARKASNNSKTDPADPSNSKNSHRKKSADKPSSKSKSRDTDKPNDSVKKESSNSRGRPRKDNAKLADPSPPRNNPDKRSNRKAEEEKEPGGRGSRAKDVSHRKRASLSGQKTKQSAKK